jgi:dethiobiotin synthetase
VSQQVLPVGLFVTGTDTEIGKTHIASLIIRELVAERVRVGVYKPVCSGAESDASGRVFWDDIERLRAAVCSQSPSEPLSQELMFDEAVCPQRFLAPLAPPIAARREGRAVDVALLKSGANHWIGKADVLIVEGAGGFLAPVTETLSGADLAGMFGYPLIVVARSGLGTINHSLLTIEAAERRGQKVAGVVLNQCHPNDNVLIADDNAAEIEHRSGVPVLGILAWRSVSGLQREGRTVTIGWHALAEKNGVRARA